ncbi:MAG: hypothetical protein QMD08_02075 [Actinomycetota bacterium]|nr:hypothetical protein [Actinomycetota bacterium]
MIKKIFIGFIAIVLLLPSFFYIYYFLPHALAFKSQAPKIIQIIDAFEEGGVHLFYISPGESKKEIAVTLIDEESAYGKQGVCGINYLFGADRERILREREQMDSKVAGLLSSTKRGDNWILYFSTVVGPRLATPEQAAKMRSIFDRLVIEDVKWHWRPVLETKLLFWLNKQYFAIHRPDFFLGVWIYTLAYPGKWFCSYILAPVLGATPYFLLPFLPVLVVVVFLLLIVLRKRG